jgi:hypothetical protein
MPPPYTGGCQCGAIRYRVTAEPLTVYACHCTECQKQTSSAFGLSMVFPADAFALTAGAPRAWIRTADSGRDVTGHFCPACGTRIWHEPAARPGTITLKPGTLDDTSWFRPVANVWTRSAQPWVRIDPDLLNFETQPDTAEPLGERYRARG